MPPLLQSDKAPDKGGFPIPIDEPGNFAGDAQIVILERVSRELVENVHKAIEELRAVRQIIKRLENEQFLEKRRHDRQQQKEEQRKNGSNGHPPAAPPSKPS
jgi:hypothetical protein